MKPLNIIAYLGVAGLAVVGLIMAKTNPSGAAYQDYAVQRLSLYLKTDVCQKTQNFLETLVKFNCEKTVDSIQPQMQDIIAATTQRQDYLLFSIYQTDLKVSSLIPSYKFETVGAFNNFYTYSAQQR